MAKIKQDSEAMFANDSDNSRSIDSDQTLAPNETMR